MFFVCNYNKDYVSIIDTRDGKEETYQIDDLYRVCKRKKIHIAGLGKSEVSKSYRKRWGLDCYFDLDGCKSVIKKIGLGEIKGYSGEDRLLLKLLSNYNSDAILSTFLYIRTKVIDYKSFYCNLSNLNSIDKVVEDLKIYSDNIYWFEKDNFIWFFDYYDVIKIEKDKLTSFYNIRKDDIADFICKIDRLKKINEEIRSDSKKIAVINGLRNVKCTEQEIDGVVYIHAEPGDVPLTLTNNIRWSIRGYCSLLRIEKDIEDLRYRVLRRTRPADKDIDVCICNSLKGYKSLYGAIIGELVITSDIIFNLVEELKVDEYASIVTCEKLSISDMSIKEFTAKLYSLLSEYYVVGNFEFFDAVQKITDQLGIVSKYNVSNYALFTKLKFINIESKDISFFLGGKNNVIRKEKYNSFIQNNEHIFINKLKDKFSLTDEHLELLESVYKDTEIIFNKFSISLPEIVTNRIYISSSWVEVDYLNNLQESIKQADILLNKGYNIFIDNHLNLSRYIKPDVRELVLTLAHSSYINDSDYSYFNRFNSLIIEFKADTYIILDIINKCRNIKRLDISNFSYGYNLWRLFCKIKRRASLTIIVNKDTYNSIIDNTTENKLENIVIETKQ